MFVLDPPRPLTITRAITLVLAALIGLAVAGFFLHFVGGLAMVAGAMI